MKQGIEHFLKRLRNYYQVNVLETRSARYSRQQEKQAIEFESKHLKKAIEKNRGYLIVLDMEGRKMSSQKLAGFLKNKQDQGVNRFTFLIGGAYGLTEEIKNQADLLLSLSDMTFTHEMARIILLEQIYRAASINAGSPYHH